MSAYIAGLKAAVERDRARREEQESAAAAQAAQAARERLTPLEDRLARLLATIPPEVQLEGLSLPSLQTALRGRWKGNCHPGELGAALRKLGFTRQRQWRRADGFNAVWRKLGSGEALGTGRSRMPAIARPRDRGAPPEPYAFSKSARKLSLKGTCQELRCRRVEVFEPTTGDFAKAH
jgi:hypothetical protein